MTDLSDDERLKLHSVFRDARLDRNSYFEKLALLDGGTIALVITAIFGVRGSIGSLADKTILVGGVAVLMVALVALLLRNLIGTELEFHVAGHVVKDPRLDDPEMKKHEERLRSRFGKLEWLGVAATFAGLLALGFEACVILFAHP